MIILWDIPSGSLLNTLTGWLPVDPFSPNGKILVSKNDVDSFDLWDLPSATLRKTLDRSSGARNVFHSFGPDSKIFVYSKNGIINLWDLSSNILQKILEMYTKLKYEPAADIFFSFSPDGSILASGSKGEIILWDMPTGKFRTCLFDPGVLDKSEKVNQYTLINAYGQTITYTLPCGSPIPAGAICTCNCISGTYSPPPPPVPFGGGSSGGGSYCTCDQVCTCVTVMF